MRLRQADRIRDCLCTSVPFLSFQIGRCVMAKYLSVILSILFSGTSYAQDKILDTYLKEGLENNLALEQQRFSLRKSLEALREARGMFLPSVSIVARYSRAGGGRSIEFPVGDLVNPVYGTLNQLLANNGLIPSFPTDLQNEQISLIRKREHDTKIRVVQPIFQPALYYNYRIKSSLSGVQQARISVFIPQLTADIKSAYFNCLKAVRVVDLYERTEVLLTENLRVSKKLFQNGKATEDVVFRAKAEICELEQNQAEAAKNRNLSAACLNFLINRPLDSHVETIDDSLLDFHHELNLQEAQAHALECRGEFRQLRSAIGAAKNSVGLTNSSFLPNVTGVLDYGFQGEQYGFTANNDYWIASLVLQWNLFNGFRDKSKHKQARLEKGQLEAQLRELDTKIKLQVQEAHDNLIVARKAIISAKERLNSVRKSFRIIDKKYRQGMSPQIEYLGARTALTNAEISQVIVKYDYCIKYAEFERVAAKGGRNE